MNYPDLPKECTSLLCKYLTPEVFEMLKKTDPMFASVNETLKQLREAATTINAMLNENRPKLTKIMDNTQVFTRNAADLSASLKEMLAKDNAKIAETLDNLRASSKRIRTTLKDVAPLITESVQNVSSVTKQLGTTITSVEKLIGKVDLSLQENRPDIREIIVNAREMSESLKLTAEDVRRHPWKLLKETKTKDAKIDAFLESSGKLSDATSDMSETLDKLIVLLQIAGDNKKAQQEIEDLISKMKGTSEQINTIQEQVNNRLKILR